MMVIVSITPTLILMSLLACSEGLKGRSWKMILPAEKSVDYHYETKYFDTFLDHFSYTNATATFKLRYLISQTFWKPGNPILFYCGNEGSIDVFSNNTGFMWELSERLSAMVVFAEHRYYGQSLPFGERSFSSPAFFGYLSAEQALADYADLIGHLKSSIGGASQSPVVAFGGSYGGMLAAWFRQKYPNVVAGALAASAPVLMVDNVTHCNNAYRVLTNAYVTKGSPACARNVRNVWPIIQGMNNSAGLSNLSKIFKTCKPLTSVDPIIDQISEALFDMGMANYPYPASFLAPMPAWPVTAFCKPLAADISVPQLLLEAVFKGIQVYYNYTGQIHCLPTDSSRSSGLDANGWNLQTCTELPVPMCTDGVTDMFYKNPFNQAENDRQCFSQFQVRPRWGWGQTLFWGNRLKAASNIIFSNGLLDPWSAGGVFFSESESIKIIPIPNGAHHLDLRASNPDDPSDVRLARKMEAFFIQKWIQEWRERSSDNEASFE